MTFLVRRARGTRRLGADRRHLLGRDGVAVVAEAVAHVGEDVGDLVVVEVRQRRHHGVELLPVDRHLSVEAVQHDADGALLVGHQEVRPGEGREHVGEAGTVRLVARRAGTRALDHGLGGRRGWLLAGDEGEQRDEGASGEQI
jgi:hypothetical protein